MLVSSIAPNRLTYSEKMLRTVALILFSAVVAYAAQACIDNSECGPGQCCNNYHGPLVASKRRRDAGSLLASAILPQKGVCENYQNEGDHCSGIDTMNGHCGCDITKGLTCQFFAAATTVKTPTSKRSMLPPWMGVNKCAPLLVS